MLKAPCNWKVQGLKEEEEDSNQECLAEKHVVVNGNELCSKILEVVQHLSTVEC